MSRARLDAVRLGACQRVAVHPLHVLLYVSVKVLPRALRVPLDQLRVLYAVRRGPVALKGFRMTVYVCKVQLPEPCIPPGLWRSTLEHI